MVKRPSEKGFHKPIYHGATLNNRVDNHLAKGDREVSYGGELSQILNSPHVGHFISEAAELKGLEDQKASIPASVYFAIATVALVAAVGGGCIHPFGGDTADNLYGNHKADQVRDYTIEASCGKCDIKVELSSELMNDLTNKKPYDSLSKSEIDSQVTVTESPCSDQMCVDARQGRFYHPLFEDPRDDKVIDDIIQQVSNCNSVKTEADKVDTIVKFVQGNIGYDFKQRYENTEGGEYHPYDALYRGIGVCSQKSLLLAELLKHAGYGVAFIEFEYDPGHAGVGIKCRPGEGSFGANKEYAYIESTDLYPIGYIPDFVERDKVGMIFEVNPGGKEFTNLAEPRERYGSQGENKKITQLDIDWIDYELSRPIYDEEAKQALLHMREDMINDPKSIVLA